MFVFIRDEIAKKMFQSSQKCMIGGLGLAVEIDESMFGMYTSWNGCKSFVWVGMGSIGEDVFLIESRSAIICKI